jgi:hypothetical protein
MHYDWESLLRELSEILISEDDWSGSENSPSPEMITTGWLGNPGATEEQILDAESRLRTQFPASYREFLKVTNGWNFMGSSELQFWSTDEIEWFYVRNQHFVDHRPPYSDQRPSVPDEEYFVYDVDLQRGTRYEYLRSALEISSDSGNGAIHLLIPDVITPEGEWESWLLSAKLPGAYRQKSFYEMMELVIRNWDMMVW